MAYIRIFMQIYGFCPSVALALFSIEYDVTCHWRLTYQELYPAALWLCVRYAAYDIPSANQFCCLLLLLVTLLVLARLDYGSIALTGISMCLMDWLQCFYSVFCTLFPTFPSLSLQKSHPLNPARGSREHYELHSGFMQSPTTNRFMTHFELKIMP